jgi:hypothetical protein
VARSDGREALGEAAAVMYSVTVLRACCGPGACAHRLRTDALASSRQYPHNAANPGTCDLPFRTIPAVADQFRQGSKDTANAVWVNSPSGVQIPEPPPLTWEPALTVRAPGYALKIIAGYRRSKRSPEQLVSRIMWAKRRGCQWHDSALKGSGSRSARTRHSRTGASCRNPARRDTYSGGTGN